MKTVCVVASKILAKIFFTEFMRFIRPIYKNGGAKIHEKYASKQARVCLCVCVCVKAFFF